VNNPAKSCAGKHSEDKVHGGGEPYCGGNSCGLFAYRRGRGTPFGVDDHFASQARFHHPRLFLHKLKVVIRETLLLFRQWP
jgi:hypothetical protein